MSESSPKREPGPLTYVIVWAALALLAGLSLLAAQVDLGGWNVIVAFAIAAIKAVLVLGVFMHLAYGPPIHRIVFVIAVLFVILIIAGVLADVGTRSVASSYLGL